MSEIYTKIGKAQMSMPNPKLDSVNPHFKSKYASLGAVLAVTKPALKEQGLYDRVSQEEGVWRLYVGDGKEEVCISELAGFNPAQIQALGSECTYMGRYLRCNAYALVGQEDDDGNAAQKTPQAPKAKPKDHLEPIRELLGEFARSQGISSKEAAERISEYMGVAAVSEIKAEDVPLVTRWMLDTIEIAQG